MGKEIVIIGGGPGGYACALKAAMLGMQVTLIEEDNVGGTCLNRGCIPTKALQHSADLVEHIKEGAAIGVNCGEVSLDLEKIDGYRQMIVGTLVKGVESLLAARGVNVVRGRASFTGSKTFVVEKSDGAKEEMSPETIIIATGSCASMPPIPGSNSKNVISSTEALNVSVLPESIAIIGGGVIGMEIGSVYSSFGVKVVVIEALPKILPNMDQDVAATYTSIAKKKMEIHTNAPVTSMEDAENGKILVHFTEKGAEKTLEVDKVLMAVGRKPNTASLHLENTEILTERTKVLVNENYETNVPGVFCIGDANGTAMFAHAATAQGVAVAEYLAGITPQICQNVVPSCVYTDPELASVGMTEQQLKDAGIAYKVGKFPVRANGRSLIVGRTNGFVKILGDAETNKVLGVHIVSAYATEIIGELVTVMKFGGTVEDIANTIHAHPSVGESVLEAAEKYLGGAIHCL